MCLINTSRFIGFSLLFICGTAEGGGAELESLKEAEGNPKAY